MAGTGRLSHPSTVQSSLLPLSLGLAWKRSSPWLEWALHFGHQTYGAGLALPFHAPAVLFDMGADSDTKEMQRPGQRVVEDLCEM